MYWEKEERMDCNRRIIVLTSFASLLLPYAADGSQSVGIKKKKKEEFIYAPLLRRKRFIRC